MIKIKVCHIIVFFFLILKTWCQTQLDSPCTFQFSGDPGICKFLTDCSPVRDEVTLHHHLPQVCGFEETKSIVCCPLNAKRRPGVISKKKCREYSQYANKKPSGDSDSKSECGHKIVKRIVGGVPSSRTEFAHMATIGFESKPGVTVWLGGGTLISEQYVLTCARFKETRETGKAKYVKLGITNLSDNDQKQEFNVAEFITHPDYKPSVAYNDIGLIKLHKPVTLHSYARPACLHTQETILVGKGIATGWGHTSFAGERSDQLLKVSLDFVEYNVCNKSYSNTNIRRLPHGIDQESHICAGSGVEQKDTCQGDSGGPLQIYHSGDDIMCMYDVVGITSFGKACFGGPGVYTKVSHYITWIEDIVWPEQTAQKR